MPTFKMQQPISEEVLRNVSCSIYYQYLEDKARNANSPIMFFILLFVLFQPFFIIIDFLVYSIKSDLNKTTTTIRGHNVTVSDFKSLAVVLLLVICFLVLSFGFVDLSSIGLLSFAKGNKLVLPALFGVVSLFVNVLSLLLIYILSSPSSYDRRIFEYRLNLSERNLCTAIENSQQATLDNLIGHRLWASKQTYDLLSDLLKFHAGAKAKWLMIKFLSEVASDRILTQRDESKAFAIYKVDTGNNLWPLSKYSKFLKDNMSHADKSIYWIVDPKDMFSIILPELLNYVFASYAFACFPSRVMSEVLGQLQKHAPKQSSHTLRIETFFKIDKNHNDRLIKNSACSKAYNDNLDFILGSSQHTTKQLDYFTNNLYARRQEWNVFNDYILPCMVRCGIILLKNKNIDSNFNINKAFENFSAEYINRVLPHFLAFRINDLVVKKRIIFLDYDNGESLDTVIKSLWDNSEFLKDIKAFVKDKNYLDVFKTQDQLICDHLMKLFCFTSGGKKNIVVTNAGGSVSDTNSLDIGFYDDNFVVRAKGVEGNPEKDEREVTWIYGYHRNKSVDWITCLSDTKEQILDGNEIRDLTSASIIISEVKENKNCSEFQLFEEGMRNIFKKQIEKDLETS